MARPTKFKKEYCKIVKDLALLGKTDRQIAAEFRISEATLNVWKKQFPEFLEAMRSKKDKADVKVIGSLFKRAVGYKYKETTIEGGKIKIVTKEVPGDVTAQTFWLRNRQKENWRDRQQIGVEFENMTEQQLDDIINRLIKANEQK